jgi:hypothetical protein
MTTEGLPRIIKRISQFKIAVMVVVGVGLAGIQNFRVRNADHRASDTPSAASSVRGVVLSATTQSPFIATAAKVRLIEFAHRDPCGLLRLAYERCQRETSDFRCLFEKQERINGAVQPAEVIEVCYRVDPLSVFMTWRRGANQAKRALFIDSQEFVDGDGQRLARVEPAGVLLRLIVSDVMAPIHDARARKASRRAIDEFGFRSTFEILERVSDLADARNELNFQYEGEGAIDGRATVILVRRLPYTGPGGRYPDAKLILHLDQESLLPIAVYSYADPEGRELLGSYVFTHVNLNPSFGEADFRF